MRKGHLLAASWGHSVRRGTHMSTAKRTIDHDEIRRWVESRGGHPAHVKRTASDGDPGVLRIDFPGFSGEETLEPIDWDTWFRKFEERQLAFLYQDEPESRFNKLVHRTDEDEAEAGAAAGAGARARPSTSARWASKTTRVTINNATREELESLWGIGPQNARRIIDFRRRKGRIRGPEDLTEINGIDNATAKLIASEVSFD